MFSLCWVLTTLVSLSLCEAGFLDQDCPQVPCARNGMPIAQVLAMQASRGDDIKLQGDIWESQGILPYSSKGPLMPESTALLLIDMQPLFYHRSSPWGTRKGLHANVMEQIWPKQLRLAASVRKFTSAADSVFLTRFVPPHRADYAQGIMRHYYSEGNEGDVTYHELKKAGKDADFLYGIMPELQTLVTSGAQVSTKMTGGAFGPSSTLPGQLEAYFNGVNSTRTIIVAGVETDFCVVSTILGALDHFYRVILVYDAIGSSQPNGGQAQLDYTFRRFDHMMDIASADEIVELLEATSSKKMIFN